MFLPLQGDLHDGVYGNCNIYNINIIIGNINLLIIYKKVNIFCT